MRMLDGRKGISNNNRREVDEVEKVSIKKSERQTLKPRTSLPPASLEPERAPNKVFTIDNIEEQGTRSQHLKSGCHTAC